MVKTVTLLNCFDNILMFMCGNLDPGSAEGTYSLLRPVGASGASEVSLSGTSAPLRYLTHHSHNDQKREKKKPTQNGET